jgi:hypothetical protein
MFFDYRFHHIIFKVIYLITIFEKYAFILACFFLFSSGKKTMRQTVQAWVIASVAFLGHSSQGGRQYPYELLVLACVLYHYIRRPFKYRHLAFAAVLLFLLLAFGGYFRSVRSDPRASLEPVAAMSDLPRGPLGDSLVYGYYTVTIGFEQFSRMTSDLPTGGSARGGHMFYFLHRFIPRQGLGEWGNYPGGVVFTYLADFYADYGIWGILAGSFLLGYAYSFVYKRAVRRSSLYWIYAQALFIYCLTYFPYVNLFSEYAGWFIDLASMAAIMAFISHSGRKGHMNTLLTPRGGDLPFRAAQFRVDP